MKSMRELTRILGNAVLLLLMAMPQAASGLQINAKEWSEDALLHDGRIIKVARKVDSTVRSGFNYVTPIPIPYITSKPDRYWLSFKHPDSKKRISWQGEQYVMPVMVDIVAGIPYLVVHSPAYLNGAKKKVYDDQIFPYVFLRYEEGGLFGKWVEIPVEQFPTILVDANLSASRNFLSKIPKSDAEWRKTEDARPPRQIQPFEKLPVPQVVALEILETKDSPSETVMSDEEKARLELSKKKHDCSQLITAPQGEYLGEGFVGDSTGKVQVPYNRNLADRICEGDSIWFIAYKDKAQGEKTVQTKYTTLTKYTSSGDLLYRIRYLPPEHTGRVNNATFRSENGYLYVDWGYPAIPMKGRLLEPKVSVPIAPSRPNNGESSQDKKSPAKLSLPVPQEVAIEILKTQDFTPEWQWPVSLSELAINEKSGPGCSKLFRWANQADKSLGHRFVNDPTGQKQVPYGELAASRICEGEFIWFIALREQPGKLVLT